MDAIYSKNTLRSANHSKKLMVGCLCKVLTWVSSMEADWEWEQHLHKLKQRMSQRPVITYRQWTRNNTEERLNNGPDELFVSLQTSAQNYEKINSVLWIHLRIWRNKLFTVYTFKQALYWLVWFDILRTIFDLFICYLM